MSSLSVSEAYSQIKALENAGTITVPATKDIITLGTIDVAAGTFTWSVPTVTQSITVESPPTTAGKNLPPIESTIGVVSTSAVDLQLAFSITPGTSTVTPAAATTTGATVSRPLATGVSVSASTSAPPQLTRAADLIPLTVNDSIAIAGGATIAMESWPVVASSATEVIVDAGYACSTLIPGTTPVDPPITSFAASISFPNHPAISLKFFILRPPVLGMGAFTLEALPITIIYSPPQGKENLNSMRYSDTETLTQKITTGLTNGTTTKTAPAYQPADILSKVSSGLNAAIAVVGSGDATSTGASVVGAFTEFAQALTGGGDATDLASSIASFTKGLATQANLFSAILGAFTTTTVSEQTSITTEADNSVTLTTTNIAQWSSANALGPGVGDRIVYMKNLRVIWVAVNGEISISILGLDDQTGGYGANAMNDLLQEKAALASGAQPTLGLSAASVASLLGQDPFLSPTPKSTVVGQPGPAVVGPPRYVKANPPNRNGSGSGGPGMPDSFTVQFNSTTEVTNTTVTGQSNIVDIRPGVVAVIFGGADETTTTTSMTATQSTDNSSTTQLSAAVSLYSEGFDDPYHISFYYDNLFGTYAAVDTYSALVTGVIDEDVSLANKVKSS